MVKRIINNLEYTFKLWSPSKTKTDPKARVYVVQHFGAGQDRDFGYYNIASEMYYPKKVYGATNDLSAGMEDADFWALIEGVVAEL